MTIYLLGWELVKHKQKVEKTNYVVKNVLERWQGSLG